MTTLNSIFTAITTTTFRTIAILLTIGMVMTSCQKEALEDQVALTPTTQTTDSKVLQLDAEAANLLNEQAAERAANADAKTTINLQLDNGNELHFFKADDTDNAEDYVVIEVQKCTSCSVSALGLMGKLGKADYAAKDIYWAFSEPGAAMPFEMANQNSFLAQSSVAVQGWAKNELNQANRTTSSSRSSQTACDNTSFRNSISGGFLDFDTYVRYDRVAKDYFREDCLQPSGFSKCIGKTRYGVKYWWNNVKKWAGKVCAKSVQTSYNNHFVEWCGGSCNANPNCDSSTYCKTYYGPQIRFETQRSNGTWRPLQDGSKSAIYEVPANETWTYGWHARRSSKQSFRLNIRYAKGYDEFDIMMDAEN